MAEYFKQKYKQLKCQGLPCLVLGKKGSRVPIELITVLGGEHNILARKLRPEYQAR